MSLYKSGNIIESFKYAIRGIAYALMTQRNLRIHFAISLFVVILSVWFSINTVEFCIIVICISITVFAEMLNSSLECLVDANYPDECSVIAKNAKDIAAGAVLCTAVAACVVGLLVFMPRVVDIFVS